MSVNWGSLLALFGGAFGLVLFLSSSYHNWYLRKMLRLIELNTRGGVKP